MKVLISGGGTGGHVFPSLAIADEITERDPSNDVLFVGTLKGLESRVVPAAGYRFEAVSAAGIAGGGFFRAISGLFHSASGVVKSILILRRFSPDVAVGMGGYASFPAIAAASIMGIPVAICEQNSVSGLANRLLGRIARRIFLSFPPPDEVSRKRFQSEKIRIVGNPVRRELAAAALAHGPAKRFPQSDVCAVFVLGGSQGAGSLNRIVPAAISTLKNRTGMEIRVTHQAGSRDVSEVKSAYRSARVDALVFDFSLEMANFYAESDLVISRAGAGAVSEIALFSKPSILVPYPFAAHGHQSANADIMEKAGAAVVIDEEDLSQKTVAGTLQRLLNCNTLERMSRAASRVAAPDAAKGIVNEMEALAKG